MTLWPTNTGNRGGADKRKGKTALFGIIAMTALLAAIAITGCSSGTSPEDLNDTTEAHGAKISVVDSWEVKDEAPGEGWMGGKLLSPDFGGYIWLDTEYGVSAPLTEDNSQPALKEFMDEAIGTDTSDVEYVDIDGHPAVKAKILSNPSGEKGTGYIALVAVGTNNLVSVFAWLPKNECSNQNAINTMKAVVDSLTITAKEYTVKLESSSGESLGTIQAYDFAEGASVLFDAGSIPDYDKITGVACSDSAASVTEKSDGCFEVTGITGGTTLTADVIKQWTVTFTDGNGKDLSTAKVWDREAAEAPAEPTRSGYDFAGWDSDFSEITSDTTINATWRERPKTYSAGTYLVGGDIPAGEYCITANGKAYYCVYPDISKASILGNDNFEGRAYVTVNDGQIFEVNRATFIASEGAKPNDAIGKSAGTYKVGYDIPAGAYKLTPVGDRAYYCVYNSSEPDAAIVQNDLFQGQNYVQVSEGQYLVLSRCTGEVE